MNFLLSFISIILIAGLISFTNALYMNSGLSGEQEVLLLKLTQDALDKRLNKKEFFNLYKTFLINNPKSSHLLYFELNPLEYMDDKTFFNDLESIITEFRKSRTQ